MGASQTSVISPSTPEGSPLVLVEPRAPPFSPPQLHPELQGLFHTSMTPRAESELCPYLYLPLQTAPLFSPRPNGVHTHGTGPLGRVRLVGGLQVVWAGNSEVQKPEVTPDTHSSWYRCWHSGLSPRSADSVSPLFGLRGLVQTIGLSS